MDRFFLYILAVCTIIGKHSNFEHDLRSRNSSFTCFGAGKGRTESVDTQPMAQIEIVFQVRGNRLYGQ